MIKIIRWIIGRILVALDKLFAPKGVKREASEQTKIDAVTSKMSLYQFEGCPFCIKVRREIKRLSLNIEIRDALKDKTREQELIQQGGKRQVPCLRINNQPAADQWIYESSAINEYLKTITNNA